MTDLSRRALAEFAGTAALVTVAVGSGIAAAQLSADGAVRLPANSTATVFGLGVLILMFGPVSGAHFNPVVSAVDWLAGRRHGTGLTGPEAAQIGGGVCGSVLANVMFDLAAFQISTHERITAGQLVGEVVATAGLIVVIFALARSGRAAMSAAPVAAYPRRDPHPRRSSDHRTPARRIAAAPRRIRRGAVRSAGALGISAGSGGT
ncbi:aquaporin [Nocardia asteroides]|uniref:aquaporin n=1 Tax=Nocardia asteroides TaxID=1824 RepID=UPI00365529CE